MRPASRRSTSPGEVLLYEFLVPMGLRPEEFGALAGVTPGLTIDVVCFQRPVTTHVARRWSLVLGTTPEFWLNLQREYDAYLGAGVRWCP